MKFKKIIIGLLIITGILIAANFVVKNYVFPFKHEKVIEKYSKENNLDPYFVLAVIKAESKFCSDAKSNKNAVGLMQITENTAKWIAEKMNLDDYSSDKLYEEEYNIKMGCFYLRDLENEFGNEDLVIAAYNAGRGKVKEWLNDKRYSKDGEKLSYIPYAETKNYVDKVKIYYKIYKFLYD